MDKANKKRSKDPKVRVTVDLRPQQYERLQSLECLVGADSKAELIRHSLQLYEYLATSMGAGASFYMRNAAGETVVIPMFEISKTKLATSD